jgi:hypothetical protein
VTDEPIDAYDVTTVLTLLGDINVNVAKITEILEEEYGEGPEEDA